MRSSGEGPSDRRERPGPAGQLAAGERHALAVRQSLRVAQRYAAMGDYDRALAWLSMIEFIEPTLPERWQTTRREWTTRRDQQLQGSGGEPPDPGRRGR